MDGKMTTVGDKGTARLSAFVGRSFLETDKDVWHEIRDMLESLTSLGFSFEDAREAQNRPVSEKIKEGINRNDVYIGLLTCRYRINLSRKPKTILGKIKQFFADDASVRWTTSEWVIEEVGYALGRDRRVILMIEDGVNFPDSDLDADTEWIRFRRDNVKDCQTQLTQIISNLIANSLPTQSLSSSTSGPADTAAAAVPEANNEEPKLYEQIEKIVLHVRRGEEEQARKIEEEVINSEKNERTRNLVRCYVARRKAEAGDVGSLEELKNLLASDPTNQTALHQLVGYYYDFGQLSVAAQTIQAHLEAFEPATKQRFRGQATEILIEDKKYADAKQLIRALTEDTANASARVLGYVRLADLAKALNDADLESCALEEAAQLSPSDAALRFRLAYRYSEMNRNQLAAYHYKFLSENDTAALNNLGAAYHALGIKGSEIDCYVKASEENPLAVANLAHAYADRGFFLLAEQYGKQALNSAEDNKTAAARARAALDEVDNQRAKESETINGLSDVTKEERAFRSDYAIAYCETPLEPFQKTYSTRHGELKIVANGTRIDGIAEFHEPLGLIGAFLSGANKSSLQRIRRLQLVGELTGRSARFTLTVGTRFSNEAREQEHKSTAEGLLIVELGATNLRFLEIEDGKSTISNAPAVK